MTENYFNFTRSEIAPLLPRAVTRVVDVGCGAGATSAWIKSLYPTATTVGLEGNAALRSELESKLDEVYIVDLNAAIPSVGAADLFLFLDVLEHVSAPENVLRQILSDMPKAGHVIVSLPNVAHLSVSAPLLFRGQFEYRDAGILDRTHVRFYVRDSAVRLLNDVGLRVEKGLESGLSGPKSRLFDRLTLGLMRDRLAKQYILLATPMPAGRSQGPIEWSLAK
jgi:SAM-dependent methyltransferase